jgi:hypothetical protein
LKNAVIFFLIFLATGFLNTIFSQRFTRHSEISLLTCSPGTSELYAHFGHSAIRVKDTTTNTDIVFNYGVFDFDTPNFYWKFVKGKLKYQLAIQYTHHFLQMYASEGREVKEEMLLLSEKEKMEVIQYLQWNYKPENRYYLYDFFYNNCSSKIWDVIKPKVNSELTFDRSGYKAKTFRKMLYPYLESAEWAQFGIDILLGIPADKIAGFEEQMYLPDYLSENMSHVYRKTANSEKTPLMSEEKIIVREKEAEDDGLLSGTWFDSPYTMAWILFFHILGFSLISGLGFKKWFDIIYFSLLGLLGALLLFMWFGTDHDAMSPNLNVLWANPFALLFVYFRIRKRFRIMNVFSVILILSGVAVLLFWNSLPQSFNPAFLPLTLLIPIRGMDNLAMYWYNFTLSGRIRHLAGKGVRR